MKRSVLGPFLAVALFISILFFYLFDQFVTSVGTESVKTWLHSEETEIQEGNLLSTVTKTQKVLFSSDFVKGIGVFDFSQGTPRVLIEFGQRPSHAPIKAIEELQIQNVGFLRKEIFLAVPTRSDLALGFSIFSERIEKIFWITNFIFYLLLGGFAAAILQLKRKEERSVRDYAEKARRAAHDLAQPLVALNSLASKFEGSSATVSTLKFVIERVNLIVDDLGSRKSNATTSPPGASVETLSASLGGLIAEKRVRAGRNIEINLRIDAELETLSLPRTELLRALANLIDNAIEAINGRGQVTVVVTGSEREVTFSVNDNGAGIPPEIISRLGEYRFSYNKESGSGLGLHSAKAFVEGQGGRLEIESTRELGTTVTLAFPVSTQTLFLATDAMLLVLDDEFMCRDAWKNYFERRGIENSVAIFKNANELEAHLRTVDKDRVFLFCDFELNDTRDGLDVIASNQLQNQAALITGCARDPRVRDRSHQLGVPVFSKANLGSLPLQFV